jgi:hypothetical protein
LNKNFFPCGSQYTNERNFSQERPDILLQFHGVVFYAFVRDFDTAALGKAGQFPQKYFPVFKISGFF